MTFSLIDLMLVAIGIHVTTAAAGGRRRTPPPPPGLWDTRLEIIDSIPHLAAPGAHGAIIAFPIQKHQDEKFPFVVFGHGCNTGYHIKKVYPQDLLNVAHHGFIVVAPASCSVGKCGSAFPNDMLTTITECKKDRSLHPSLAWADFTRVGIYGHSLGASHTVLDARVAKNYSIKGVVAQHPCNFMSAKSLQEVECPILLTGGDKDDICPPQVQAEMYRNFTEREKAFVVIENAVHDNVKYSANSPEAQLELKVSMEWLRCYVRGEHCHTVHQKELCANPGLRTCGSTSVAPSVMGMDTVIV